MRLKTFDGEGFFRLGFRSGAGLPATAFGLGGLSSGRDETGAKSPNARVIVWMSVSLISWRFEPRGFCILPQRLTPLMSRTRPLRSGTFLLERAQT